MGDSFYAFLLALFLYRTIYLHLNCHSLIPSPAFALYLLKVTRVHSLYIDPFSGIDKRIISAFHFIIYFMTSLIFLFKFPAVPFHQKLLMSLRQSPNHVHPSASSIAGFLHLNCTNSLPLSKLYLSPALHSFPFYVLQYF